MSKANRLLILGPSFRRRKDQPSLPAIERFDGLFYRVARKYMNKVKDVDILVMKDDLTIVDGSTPLAFSQPQGSSWGAPTIEKNTIERAKRINDSYLKRKLGRKEYSEIFISMGRTYAGALPNSLFESRNTIFPTSGGPGVKALALKNWINK